MHFERERRDVLVGDLVVRRVLHDAAGKRRAIDGHDIHEVEDAAQIHRERFLALADEHAARLVATGDRHVIEKLARVSLIALRVAEGLGADEVVRLAEHIAAADDVRDGRALPLAAVAAHDVQRVRLVEVEQRAVVRAHRADILERHRNLRAADDELNALVAVAKLVREAELEREVFVRVAVAVDVDLVQRGRIEREVIRATVRVLQRQVVRKHRDVARAAGLVAVEDIEVGRVHGGHARDGRRLAMARCETGERQ